MGNRKTKTVQIDFLSTKKSKLMTVERQVFIKQKINAHISK